MHSPHAEGRNKCYYVLQDSNKKKEVKKLWIPKKEKKLRQLSSS